MIADQNVTEEPDRASLVHPDADRLTADDFKAAFRHHPGGVALITATDGHRHVALTASSVASVSADPPLFLFSVSSASSSAPVLFGADTLVVHLLDAPRLHLARIGATSGIDRFGDGSRWFDLPTGERVFHEAPVWIRARVEHRIDAGGSMVFVAVALQSSRSAEAIDALEPREELAYVNRAWHRLGQHSLIG